MIDDEILAFLSVMASGEDSWAAIVPKGNERIRYRCVDDQAEWVFVDAPAHAFVYAFLRCLHQKWHRDDDDPEVVAILFDIQCVFVMMLDLSADASYHWYIDKKYYGISGPYDRGWKLVRRLSRLALSKVKSPAPQEANQSTFVRVLSIGEVTSIEVSVDENGSEATS